MVCEVLCSKLSTNKQLIESLGHQVCVVVKPAA